MKTPDNNRVLNQLAKIVEETLKDGFTIEELAGAISTGIARHRAAHSIGPDNYNFLPLQYKKGVRSEPIYDIDSLQKTAQAKAAKLESEKVAPLTGWPSGIIFLQGEIQNCDYCTRFSKKSPQPDCDLHGFDGTLTRERAWQETVNKKNWPMFRSANNIRPGYCICEYVTDGAYWLVNPTCPAHREAALEAMKSGLSLFFAKYDFFTATPDFWPNGHSTSVLSQIQAGLEPVKSAYNIINNSPALGNLAQAAKEAAEALIKAGTSPAYPVDKNFFKLFNGNRFLPYPEDKESQE